MAKLSKKAIERRVDKAMNAASIGLSVPVSGMTAMWRRATEFLTAKPDTGDAEFVAECRSIMVNFGATVGN